MKRPTFIYPPPRGVPVQAWVLVLVLLTVIAAAVLR
jgi:hypothetical protein